MEFALPRLFCRQLREIFGFLSVAPNRMGRIGQNVGDFLHGYLLDIRLFCDYNAYMDTAKAPQRKSCSAFIFYLNSEGDP